MKFTIFALVFLCAIPASAQKLSVKIIDRQEHDGSYNYFVPGHSYSNSDTNVNCNGSDSYANCNGTSTTNTVSTPALLGSFSVRGATFSLLLPDGRIAVVNCDIKFAEHFAGAAGNHRNCRQPLVDNIQADFHGGNAKLEWVVGLDGKKRNQKHIKCWEFLISLRATKIKTESPRIRIWLLFMAVFVFGSQSFLCNDTCVIHHQRS
jgi:hypothetical protein